MTNIEKSTLKIKEDVNKKLESLILEQKVMPLEKLDDVVANFWPEDESVDEFITNLKQWRKEEITRGKI